MNIILHTLTVLSFFLLFPHIAHAQTAICRLEVTSPSLGTISADIHDCIPANDLTNYTVTLTYPDGVVSAPFPIEVVDGAAIMPIFIGSTPQPGRYTVHVFYSGSVAGVSTYTIAGTNCVGFQPSAATIPLGTPIALTAVNCNPAPDANNNYYVELRLPDGSAVQLSIPVIAGTSLAYTYVPPFMGTYSATLFHNGDMMFSTSFIVGVPSTTPPTPLHCGGGSESIDTAIGCIPINDITRLTGFFVAWSIGIGGGIASLLILYSGIMVQTAVNNPKRLQAGRELFTSASAGLILVVFSVFLLRVIGVDILQILW